MSGATSLPADRLLITVAPTGQNQIIGIFGANGHMDVSDIDRLKPALKILLALKF